MNSNTKYITGSFFDFEVNFVIENLPESKNKKLDLPYSFYLTEKNLLRGIQTKPSNKLLKKIQDCYPKDEIDFNKKPYLIDESEPVWTDITIAPNIKKKSDNPQYEFYKNLKSDLGEMSFATKFFVPEFDIHEFCPNAEKKGARIVDFFVPNAGLVIEIDGKQHDENTDKSRDEILKQYSIQTIRISTQSVRDRDETYFEKIDEIKKLLARSLSLKSYKKNFDNKSSLDENYQYTSIAICRFQLLLCELIKSGQLRLDSKKWNLDVRTDFKCSDDINWVNIAVDDFFDWIIPISKIYDENISKPDIHAYLNAQDPDKKSLKIDFSLFQRPSEEISKNISVKSAYLNKIKIYKGNKGLSYKDYNSISSNIHTTKEISFPLTDNAMQGLNEYLTQLFGHQTFKDGQFRIIERILVKKNTLGLLPTGGGKSLCFQLPSSLSLGCCVVVCPIIALMRDHKEELERLGFNGRAEIIDSDLSVDQKNEVLEKIRTGKCNFVFISPERFQNEDFRNSILTLSRSDSISYLVIDEVHCLSEWGHDFRVSYLALPNTIFNVLKLKMPVIGLTATASMQVLTNIKNEIKLNDDDVIYKMENRRDELNYNISLMEHKKTIKVREDKDKYDALIEGITQMMDSDIMQNENDAGLIFTMHKNGKLGCCELELEINKDLPDIKTGIYASNPEPTKWVSPDGKNNSGNAWSEYKYITQQRYKNNDINLMIATKSFGMGINKENIRFSIHYGMPSSLEALYQEAGRCGRDGGKAENLVLFSDPPSVEIDDYIFNPNTPIEKIKEFQKKHEFVMSDMISQLFLLVDGKESAEDETAECLKILNKLYTKNFTEEIVLRAGQEEKLYRLFQLGIVTDWTRNKIIGSGYDSNKNVSFGVKFKKLSDKQIPAEMCKNILNEIKKYEKSQLEIDKHSKALEAISKSQNKKDVNGNIIKYLISWSNDTFFRNRLQSLKNLYDYCRDFKNTGPAVFKEKIDAYFRVDTISENISKNIDSSHYEAPKKLDQILLDDNHQLIEKEKVDNIIYTVARFLESYKSNPWLDLLSAMCRLITGSFDDADGKVRLYQFVKDAKESAGNWKETLTGLLDFAQYLSSSEREELSKVFCTFIDDQDELFLVHKYLRDKYSALIFMSQINTRIRKML
jgi:ATP-dependent DNA helicase RecQ